MSFVYFLKQFRRSTTYTLIQFWLPFFWASLFLTFSTPSLSFRTNERILDICAFFRISATCHIRTSSDKVPVATKRPSPLNESDLTISSLASVTGCAAASLPLSTAQNNK